MNCGHLDLDGAFYIVRSSCAHHGRVAPEFLLAGDDIEETDAAWQWMQRVRSVEISGPTYLSCTHALVLCEA